MKIIKAVTPLHLNRLMQHMKESFCAPLAKKLATPVKINGAEFDGTKDIEIKFSPEVDAAPQEGSDKLITSGGVYKAVNDALASIIDGDELEY